MAPTDRIGRVFAGYRLEALLGSGALSATYTASRFGTRRAIRILHPELVHDARARESFAALPTGASTIRHPGVVRFYDVASSLGGEIPFHLMDLVTGATLAQALAATTDTVLSGGAREGSRRYGSLAPARVLTIAAEVLSVLDAAHSASVIHARLEPRRIVLADRVVVLDFGSPPAAPVSGEGGPFQACEAAMGLVDQLDARVDVFSVGAIMHELLTGRTIFAGSGAALGVALATRQVAPVLTVMPSLRPDLAAIVDRALMWDRRERFETAAAMRTAVLGAAERASAIRLVE